MNKEIKKKIEDWNYIQNLGFDVLKMLTDEQLNFTVGKNMGTLGEQFRHMARVRLQYAEAVETRKVGNTSETIDPDIAKSTTRLTGLWENANQKLLSALEKANPDELEGAMIDWRHWGVDGMNIHDHLNVLMDHETLHNGQIIVYLRTMGLKFPKSWAAWGL